jgi:3D (Asp-Asp-Asp) domain-containing protein
MLIQCVGRRIGAALCCVGMLLALMIGGGTRFSAADKSYPARLAEDSGAIDRDSSLHTFDQSGNLAAQIGALRVRHGGPAAEDRHDVALFTLLGEEVFRPRQVFAETSRHALSSRGMSALAPLENDWMTFTATWYSPKGGQGDGLITATGSTVKEGWTIAVDPKVIPLFSVVEIRFPDGSRHVYQALDTGGAIVGHRVDIFNASEHECVKNGVQQVFLRIIRRGR